MKRTLCILMAAALAGCTTVDDFRKMSPQDRASRVCDRDREVNSLRRSKQTYVDAIRSAQEALGRGYRVHKACQEVSVPAGSERVCQAVGTQTVCRENQILRRETRCQETPVPINPDNERRNVSDWNATAAAVDQQLQAAFAACYQRVLPLSPEQAYQLY